MIESEIALKVLQDYGFVAFLVASVLGFAGLLINKILHHFMNSITAKDCNILEMGQKFSRSIDDHSNALHELAKTYLHIANESGKVTESVDRLSDGFDKLEEKNSYDHSRILEFVGGQRRH